MVSRSRHLTTRGANPNANPKMSSDLQGPALPAVLDVIIQFDHKPGNSDTVTIAGMGGAMNTSFKGEWWRYTNRPPP